jgi:hypothetical protein
MGTGRFLGGKGTGGFDNVVDTSMLAGTGWVECCNDKMLDSSTMPTSPL